MTNPLVLLFHERVLPGGQLLLRLQDDGYRVQVISDPQTLLQHSLDGKPLLVVVDLAMNTEQIRQAVASLREHPATSHIPVIAYAPVKNPELLKHEETPGATVAVNDSGLLLHLTQILEQALHID